MGIKLTKEVSVTNVVGWFFTIVAFVWIMAVEFSAAESRIKQVELDAKNHTVLINKLTDKSSEHSETLIRLKSADTSMKSQLRGIKEDTRYLRDKIDKILDKINK